MNIYRPDWQQDASCKGMNPNIFMPKRGDHAGVKRAVNICHNCPVIQQCRDYGFQLDAETLTFGIFGGLTAYGREKALHEERRTGKPSAVRIAPTPGLNATPGLSATNGRRAS